MKKTLSLILTVMMLLGCLSVTAFAGAKDPGVAIAGTMLTADGKVSNDAITSGTVTYTAASGSNPAKLILNNAVISGLSGPCEAPIISVNDLNLVIELIGNNQVTAGSNAAVISMGTELTITGSGSLIIHGNGGDGSVAIRVKGSGGITLSEGCKMVGSPSTTETDISKMTEATFSTENRTYMIDEAVAQTVAIYNSNAASGKSGTTDITATKAEPLSYKIVIPQAITITEADVVEIGTPSVEEVKNATENTVISYTASGTQLTLENSDKTMATSYYTAYTDKDTNTPLTNDAIVVYKNDAVVDPLTTLYVGVTESDWNAADAGTYTATVTFDFAAEEKEEATKKFETVGEVLGTVEEGFPTEDNEWQGDFEEGYEPPCAYSQDSYLYVDCEYRALIGYETSVSESQTTPGDYVAVQEGYNSTFHAYMAWTITFHMTDNVLTSIDAKLDYYANSTGEKTQDLTTYNHTNIKPFVGEPK